MTLAGGDFGALTFESAGVAMYGIDRDGAVVLVNAAVTALTGWTEDELMGRSAHEMLHRPQRSGAAELDALCRTLDVANGSAAAHDDGGEIWHRDGSPVPVWWVAAPVAGNGAPAGTMSAVVVFGDATGRRARSQVADQRIAVAESRRDNAEHRALLARDAAAAAHAETARLTTLTALSDLLNGLDILSGLDRVAELVVRAGLADVCVIDRVTSDGGLARVSLAGSGLAADEIAAELRILPPMTRDSVRSLAQVLRGADTVVVDLSGPEPGRPWTNPLDEAQALLFDTVGASQALVVALAAGGRVLGAMTLTRRDAQADISSSDLLMARLFALRIGQWLENLRLNDLQHQAALVLQRSLLTALPEPDDLEIVGRYQPATEGVEIGGDWYDAVVTPGGQTVVAIGDVSGHDVAAAARMAQLRSMLRFAVLRSPLDPAGALAEVDAAMPALGVGDSATAVLGVLSVEDGSGTLIWSSAGHLPPLIIDPDGTSRLLERPADLLLGVDPGTDRHEHRVTLPAGSTLVLYTDGLVERRLEGIDSGLRRLVAAATSLAEQHLPDLCDGLLKALVPGAGTDDDVAILAVRLRRPAAGDTGGTGIRRS